MSLSVEMRRLARIYAATLTPLREEIEAAVNAGQVAVRRCDLGSLLEQWAGEVETLERDSAALRQLAAIAGAVVATPPTNGGQAAPVPADDPRMGPEAATAPPWGFGGTA